MSDRMTALASRLLALGLLLFLLSLLWFAVIGPILQAYETLDLQITSLETQLRSFRVSTAGLEDEARRSKTLQEATARQALFYREASLDIAAAKLQQALSELVRANQGQMRMAQIEQKPKEQALQKISVNLTFAISQDGLMNLLYAVESLRPVVFIDQLSIRSNRALLPIPAAAHPAAKDGPYRTDPVLDIALKASAYTFWEQAP